jgi:predicted DNA binding CopG/RHH family protein
MIRKSENIAEIGTPLPPKFSSEQEEAEWWSRNPDFILEQFKRAKAEGRLNHGTAMKQLAEKQTTKSTTIRLDSQDIELAKQQAESKGLRYQTYLKMLLHEALGNEAAKATR